ncbi:hypothetical protein B0H66DRAFT_485605 [Apodospora peruviana]|uniref:Uncharacterized protein n=1 Tax=Apodospora peruviana TaxID=516989 RepID=A0AAE0HT81_9PEZI|nr:hypothetical protein B0H66DRAFT_485605 [Apodospora peruviana]
MVHEQRQSFDSESKRHQEQIHQLNERLEHQKLVFERESDAREKAVREKQADYQSRQLALQEELQVQKVRFAAEIQKIRTYYEERSKKLESTLEKQNAYHSTQESQLMAHHRHEMESLKAQLQAEIEQIKDSSSSYTKSLHHQFEEEIGAHREHFTQEMQRMADSHQDELRRLKLEHERTIESLRSDSGDQIRQATDSDLMGLFRRLKLAIEVVTYNLGTVTISEASQLDPTNFLKRERGRQQVLLRSILWSKILEGYFSSPFGFGVFGAGSGKKMLVELFLYWRKLFAIHHAGDANTGVFFLCQVSSSLPIKTPVPDANFDIHDLWRDKEANRWRSATFQSVMAIMAGKGGKNGSADTADEGGQTVGNLYVMNRVKLKKDILAVLEEATSDQLAGEIEEKLDEITCLAGELALQIGVHRACLGLEMPATGESVIIGPEFVDCEDGAAARGETEEVDLVVCPHFFKVGDGRSDLKTRKSIFPGEIYPVRP